MKYNLVVIGSGIAGSSLSYIASKDIEISIAIIEKNIIGGEISRFGGAASLLFGKSEIYQYNLSSEKKLKEVYRLGAPVEKYNCRIYTSKEYLFPNAKKNNFSKYLEQECYISNPAELSVWLLQRCQDNGVDIYEGMLVNSINSDKKVIHTTSGKSFKYDNLVLATGNHNSLIDGCRDKSKPEKFKRLCVLHVDFINKENIDMNFYHELDSYFFYDKKRKMSVFCFPTEQYEETLPSNIINYSLNRSDIKRGEEILKKIYDKNDYRVVGGRVFYEGYTENRHPRIGLYNNIPNIHLMNSFSGSGLRLSFGVAQEIINNIKNGNK